MMAEPWLRERILPCDPTVSAVLFALEQAEEDLARFVPPPKAYFHLRHIAGSLDRLTAYLEKQTLTEAQMAALGSEEAGSETHAELLEHCRQAFARTRAVLLQFPPAQFGSVRYVGRKGIRTTAIGLMIHMAEHTQRHIGQIIAYSRVG